MGEMGEIYKAFSDPEGAKTLPVGAAYTRGVYIREYLREKISHDTLTRRNNGKDIFI